MSITVFRSLVVCAVFFLLAGCGDDSSVSSEANPPLSADSFVTRLVEDWEGVDYSSRVADGTTDSDGDGQIDTDDAVSIIETLRAYGYDVPRTTVSGLVENFYPDNGYDYKDDEEGSGSGEVIVTHDYEYTLPSSVTSDDLKNADWSGLVVGDLIALDYDKDFIWDNAVVYLGAHGDYEHAAILASDYYDEVVVLDLDDPDGILALDIAYGSSTVRKLNLDGISGVDQALSAKTD